MSLEIAHPRSGEPMSFMRDIPAELKDFMTQLK
jgi:hypothetical protein